MVALVVDERLISEKRNRVAGGFGSNIIIGSPPASPCGIHISRPGEVLEDVVGNEPFPFPAEEI